jgi:hypothetical protein
VKETQAERDREAQARLERNPHVITQLQRAEKNLAAGEFVVLEDLKPLQ